MAPSFSTQPGYPVALAAPIPLLTPKPVGSNFGVPRKSATRGKRKRTYPPQTDSDAEELDGNPPSPPSENPNAAPDVFPKVRISRIKAQPPRRRLRRDKGNASEPAVDAPELVTNATRRDSGGETGPHAGVVPGPPPGQPPGPPPALDDAERTARCDTPNGICYRCLAPVYINDEDNQTGPPNANQGGFSAPQPAPWMPYSQGDFAAGLQTGVSRIVRQFPQPAWGGGEAPPQFSCPAPSFPWGRNQMDVTALQSVNAGVEKPYIRDGDLYHPDAVDLLGHNMPLQPTFSALNSNAGQGNSFPAFGQETSFFGGSGHSFDSGVGGGLLGLQNGLQGGCVGGLPGCSGYNQMSGDC